MAEILRASGVHVVEFRASIVICSGSLSFEMIPSLVERLPVMVTPKWVGVTAQPIAVTDLLNISALHYTWKAIPTRSSKSEVRTPFPTAI